MATERELLDAVASQPPNDGLLIIDGGGREIAARPAGEDGAMQVIVLGPVDAMLEDGAAPAIRPGEDGAEGAETGELTWAQPQRRREVRRERNQATHALRRRAAERRGADGARSHVGAARRPGRSRAARCGRRRRGGPHAPRSQGI